MTNRWVLITALAAALVFLGCRERAADSHSPHGGAGSRAAEFATNVTAYEVKGVLKEIRAQGWKALIAHEDIPGYMEAMTMLLDVRRSNDLAGLTPGDAITFRMLVTETDGWIDRVQKVGSARPTESRTNAAAPTDVFEELEPGALLPDCVLTNQLGQQIRLSDFKGRTLAFTFIFTRRSFQSVLAVHVHCSFFRYFAGSLLKSLRQDLQHSFTSWPSCTKV